ncbi:MAG: DUF3341 domain-containing protein [Candidatus Sericytochromatia bacterium]|nr:DUF3341 domain-containing protein [Candidatus Tanganyikabacteria bacterium]
MADVTVLGVFREVDNAAQGVQNALKANFTPREIDVITAVPYPDEVWGLPAQRTNLRKIAAMFWVIGFSTGTLLAGGSAWLYPLPTGGKPIFSLPTSAIIIYELAMLFGIFASAIGTLWESGLPNFNKLPYHSKVTEGWPAVTVLCRGGANVDNAENALKSAGADEIVRHS